MGKISKITVFIAKRKIGCSDMKNSDKLSREYRERADYSDVKILGKTPREYMEESLLEDENFAVVNISADDADGVLPDGTDGFGVLLYTDMPLVSKSEIISVTEAMAYRNLNELRSNDALFFRQKPPLRAAAVGMRGDSFLSVKDAASYAAVYGILRRRILDGLIEKGARIQDTNSVTADSTVIVKKGTVIAPYNIIRGRTYIGEDNFIDGGNIIDDAYIGDNNAVAQSNLCGCYVGNNCAVGPFATLRHGANIGNNCRIGDYVEIKKAVLGDGVKAAHLAYIGDAEIGEGSNVGCGTVFANYDGKVKRRTTVGSNVFIGANTNLVAPLRVGDNAFIAAGSTVTDDVPENAFAIAREKQTVKKNYADKYKK
ncbi:MAG: hypothetical protein LBP79_01450 [Clostridiales bacterium]|jgi:UDP-3-O-[3-hydroxymyristoyl] glucosamine N-acyltransferase|nr:hypothetical protein [Clostridiales bacterium]